MTRRHADGGARVLGLLVLLAVAAGPARAEVTLRATISSTNLAVGESARLELQVLGASTGVGTPQFDVPPGLEVAPAGRSQSFSWVNGRSEQSTRIAYEVVALAPGRHTLGPMVVRVGRDTYSSGTVTVEVEAARAPAGPQVAGRSAELRADLAPASPYVGQPVTLRVRLLLRTPISEDPEYAPPETQGFWSGPPSPPQSYYAGGGERALVTETRIRLYPLTPGVSRVGPARATLQFGRPFPGDPFGGAGVRAPAREMTVTSAPFGVRVRPLPPGAPDGWGGAVGVLSTAFSLDRARTSRDVPVTVRFDVRGRGNLPLIGTPALDSDGEIYAGSIEDSAAAPGADHDGRRRFQWTVLPRREGALTIQPPAFSWFDPEAEVWRRSEFRPIVVNVGPPLASGAVGGEESFPAAIARHLPSPGSRPARPWALSLAGLLAGAAIAAWRTRPRPDPVTNELSALSSEVERSGGAEFWSAAERAVESLARRGRAVETLQRVVRAARYGGALPEPGGTRARLLHELRAARPRRGPGRGPLAAALLAAATTLALIGAPRAGDPRARTSVVQADVAARAGEDGRARAGWLSAWRSGGDPALAARLAWAGLRAGDVASASAWVLRGRALEGRDPALAWASERTREAGGLLGAGAGGPPVTRLEWALGGLVLGLLAGLLWPRRGVSLALALLALACGLIVPVEALWRRATPRAVTRLAIELPGGGVTLEPGQVVRVLERSPGRLRVQAGRDAGGWAPASAFETVESGR